MTKPKFKIGDHVMYQGNIYKIHSIETNHMNFIYNVVCVKNIIPYDSIAVSLGMAAEDDMSLVDFYPPEKEEWLNDVCKWLKDNIDLEHDYPNNADELIRDLRNYIYNKEKDSIKIQRTKTRKVRCITTGEVFDTVTKAANKYGFNTGRISECCKGKREFINTKEGLKLKFEYVK